VGGKRGSGESRYAGNKRPYINDAERRGTGTTKVIVGVARNRYPGGDKSSRSDLSQNGGEEEKDDLLLNEREGARQKKTSANRRDKLAEGEAWYGRLPTRRG